LVGLVVLVELNGQNNINILHGTLRSMGMGMTVNSLKILTQRLPGKTDGTRVKHQPKQPASGP
jgi:hypothetical protein